MKKTILGMTLFICGLTLVQPNARAQETGTLEAQSTEAYLSLMDGDQLLEAGEQEAALAKYLESQKQYTSLRELDPEFKNRVVSYRLELLEEKIAALAPEPSPAPAPEGGETTHAEISGSENFQELYLQTREKLSEETARVTLLERRMIEADTVVRELRLALSERSAELQDARQERIKLSRQIAALEEETKDVAKFNELLKERTEEVEARNRELIQERGRLAGQVAEQQERLEPLESELEIVSTKLAEQNLTTSQGQQRLILERNQLRDDKTELQRRLAEQTTLFEQMQERIEDVALLEEAVIVLNNRNEAQAAQLEALKSTPATPDKEIARLNKTIEDLQQRLNNSRREANTVNQNLVMELREKNNNLSERNTQLQQKLGSTSLTLKAQEDLIATMQAALEATPSADETASVEEAE